MNFRQVFLWFVDAILRLIGLYFGYLTVVFCWAAGGPPGQYKDIYANRCILDFALACAFIVASIILFAVNIRRMMKSRVQKSTE